MPEKNSICTCAISGYGYAESPSYLFLRPYFQSTHMPNECEDYAVGCNSKSES